MMRGEFLWMCEHLIQIKTDTSPSQPLQLSDSQHYLYERDAKPSWTQQQPPFAVVMMRDARCAHVWVYRATEDQYTCERCAGWFSRAQYEALGYEQAFERLSPEAISIVRQVSQARRFAWAMEDVR